MPGGDEERLIRLAAFTYVHDQVELHGEVLPAAVLRQGFPFKGQRVPLQGPQGIFKPAVLSTPLSITSAPIVMGRNRPYEDTIEADGLLRYRYRGTDPNHHDNVGLRRAMAERLPLVYFHGIARGKYLAEWPVFVVGDDPQGLTFTVAIDELLAASVEAVELQDVATRRAYITRLARQRLHQAAFRFRVLRAYHDSCSMCRLRHPELLDAAHILPDIHPGGEPVTSNGLSLCKLHHAAFDKHVVGIRPDLVMEVRDDILNEIDGPMLRHGLQDLHGTHLLVVPRKEAEKPDPDFLDERYQLFRAAG